MTDHPHPPTTPPAPGEPVAERLKALIDERTAKGIATYGVPLAPHNGRDAQRDALEESLDLNQYLMQMVVEAQDELAQINAIDDTDDDALRQATKTLPDGRVKGMCHEVLRLRQAWRDFAKAIDWPEDKRACVADLAKHAKRRIADAEASLKEMVQAMEVYQLDVDTDPPPRHSRMMRRAYEVLSAHRAASEGQVTHE